MKKKSKHPTFFQPQQNVSKTPTKQNQLEDAALNRTKIIAICILLLLGGASLLLIYHFLQQQRTNLDKIQSPDSLNKLPLPTNPNTDCKIFMDDRYVFELQNTGREDWLPLIDKQIEQIRNLLPKSFNAARLNNILKQNIVEIEIVPQNDPRLVGQQKTAPQSRFIPSMDLANERHKILIVQDSDFSGPEIEKILSHSLHNLSTLTATLKRLGNPERLLTSRYMLLPFLSKNWEVDKDLRQKHTDCLAAALKEIEKFSKQHPDKMSTRYKKALESYQPFEFHQYIPTSSLEALMQVGESLNKKIKIKIDDVSLYIHDMNTYGSETSIHYTYAASNSIADKATAFLQEIKSFYQQVYHGPYKAVCTEEEQDMEFSSFIEEFPPSIKEVFFKEWCDYFSQYTQQEDYCSLKNTP